MKDYTSVRRLLDYLDKEGVKDLIIEWAVWKIALDTFDTELSSESRRNFALDRLNGELNKWLLR